MPPDPRPLTDRAILNRVGQRSYDLGQDYLADRALSHCRRIGRTLEARVSGTAANP